MPAATLETPDLIRLETLPRLPKTAGESGGASRLWMPRRVVFTPAALEQSWGQQIYDRVRGLGLPVEELSANRLTDLKGTDSRDTYRRSKSTLAVVTAPPSALRLQPIPPSADWQFHVAEGCPAHCQYCYLAGSLSGPPVVRAFANLPQILDNMGGYIGKSTPGQPTTFEVSCYTDPLGIEHLTGSLAAAIRWFGERPAGSAQLRWVSKFDAVDPLLSLPYNGNTRCRVSVNAAPVSRYFEGGVAPVAARLAGLRKLALPRSEGGGGYLVGVVIAPIMPEGDWQADYTHLLDNIAAALDFPCDLTFELITHRFTPGSKETLLDWYPKTTLNLDEAARETKRNKFGGIKYVYPKATLTQTRAFFEREIAARFPQAKVLYFT